MKQNNSQKSIFYSRIFGIVVLAVLWIVLICVLFDRGGFNPKNVLTAIFSGIIIFYPLWKKYLQPIFYDRKKNNP